MSDAVVVAVERQLQALRDLRKSKRLDYPMYGKMVVRLSSVYVEVSMMAEALALLRSLPLEYYTEHHLGQMLADAEFEQTSVDVANAMAAAGFDKAQEEIFSTMPGGDA